MFRKIKLRYACELDLDHFFKFIKISELICELKISFDLLYNSTRKKNSNKTNVDAFTNDAQSSWILSLISCGVAAGKKNKRGIKGFFVFEKWVKQAKNGSFEPAAGNKSKALEEGIRRTLQEDMASGDRTWLGKKQEICIPNRGARKEIHLDQRSGR